MATWVGSSGNYSTSGTFTVSLPAGWQPGDLAVLVVGGDSGTDTAWGTPSGWTFQKKTAATNMFSYVFTRVLQAGDTAPLINKQGSAGMGVWRDVALGTVGAFGVRSGTSFTVTSPDIATTGYRAHIFSDRSSAATAGEADTLPTALTYGTSRGLWGGNPTVAASTGICAVYFVDSAPGQSGANTATLIDSATNAWGLQIDLGPGTVVAAGRPKAYVDGSFQKKPGKVNMGTPQAPVWVEKPWKRWTGTAWETLK